MPVARAEDAELGEGVQRRVLGLVLAERMPESARTRAVLERVRRHPPAVADGGDEIDCWGDRVGDRVRGGTVGSVQFEADDAAAQRVAQSADDHADPWRDAGAQVGQRGRIEHHVRVDLDEELGPHTGDAGVERAVKRADARDPNQVRRRLRLPIEARQGAREERFADRQHDRGDVARGHLRLPTSHGTRPLSAADWRSSSAQNSPRRSRRRCQAVNVAGHCTVAAAVGDRLPRGTCRA